MGILFVREFGVKCRFAVNPRKDVVIVGIHCYE